MTWGVLLDRDGTINESPPAGEYLCDPARVRLAPGAAAGIAALNRAGAIVCVVTNQRGIALGLCTGADVESVHVRIQQLLASSEAHIDAWYVCPHDLDQCQCRKPGDGLVRRAIDEQALDPSISWIVGDRVVDVLAGATTGLGQVLIGDEAEAEALGVAHADDLREASQVILSRH